MKVLYADTVNVFDKYASFTDVTALKEFSGRPLRKSLRVNTLKCSVEFFLEWARRQEWQITPVPWCSEAFFVDREDRSKALGKDLLHLLGWVYMQEAASMLPVALLDPQPGEAILDMSAAPGSKTTQIAARLCTGTAGEAQMKGVVVANDVQEKRLWTLKTALYRLGCTNAIVTKKQGQWFGGHMTECFDRVLCDAPCTAQGTIRKDPTALDYSSEHNVRIMSNLQKELLESAVHAAKVGGRIVYSTCTLTSEENEEVVLAILKRFEGCVEAVDVRTEAWNWNREMGKAVDDSAVVQDSLQSQASNPKLPMLRLWPQTFDTEGFFCAVLRKTASTKEPAHLRPVRFQEDIVPKARTKELTSWLEDRYGTSFIIGDDQLFCREDQFVLSTQDVSRFSLPVENFSLGIPFARRAGEKGFRLDHEMITLRGSMATKNITSIDNDSLAHLLDGKDIGCDPALRGDSILTYRDIVIGLGLARDGHLKNRLPRWIVQKS